MKKRGDEEKDEEKGDEEKGISSFMDEEKGISSFMKCNSLERFGFFGGMLHMYLSPFPFSPFPFPFPFPPTNLRILLELFRRLKSIMERERGNNWLPGIAIIVSMLEDVDPTDHRSIAATVGEVRSIYRGMHGGMGSFGDYYVHRDDSTERIAANKELDAVRDEIWTFLKT